jgi:hypothetical protein
MLHSRDWLKETLTKIVFLIGMKILPKETKFI